jgi:hypothetical protein
LFDGVTGFASRGAYNFHCEPFSHVTHSSDGFFIASFLSYILELGEGGFEPMKMENPPGVKQRRFHDLGGEISAIDEGFSPR